MKINKLVCTTTLTSLCVLGSFFAQDMQAQAARPKIYFKTKTVVEEPVDYSAIFNAEYYYNTYPDLQAAIGKDSAALYEHFVEHGMKEGRNGSPVFDLKAYMKNNLDVVAELKADDLTEYYKHYIKNGMTENRIATYQEGQQPGMNVMASHTTYYDVTEERAHNVELASARINGIVLQPGQSFSFSNAVGTRTVENGYVNGPSFASGKEVESIGGGICQVSSTLYVTMLLAGIEPTEHHYHGLPVDYVPAGLDAAIAENFLDLRFRNDINNNYNIVIESTAADGVHTISLLRQEITDGQN